MSIDQYILIKMYFLSHYSLPHPPPPPLPLPLLVVMKVSPNCPKYIIMGAVVSGGGGGGYTFGGGGGGGGGLGVLLYRERAKIFSQK